METLKIGFLDFWPEFNEENIFLPILKKYYNIEVSLNNPDIILHSIFNGMKETPKYKCKKILFLGENYRPSQFKSDYSISFDPHTKTNYRLPLWQFYCILDENLKNSLFGQRVNHENFDRFASFVVSNPGNIFRNGFFNTLSDQKIGKIYSYGRYMTNDPELQEASRGQYWRKAKQEFFKKYKHKYAIAFENNAYPYYCTEKLMDAFIAGSMPLYWGGPKISEDWNKEAFINVGVIGIDEAIIKIKKMESDYNLYLEKYAQPIFTDEQKNKHIANMHTFEDWLIDIIKK